MLTGRVIKKCQAWQTPGGDIICSTPGPSTCIVVKARSPSRALYAMTRSAAITICVAGSRVKVYEGDITKKPTGKKVSAVKKAVGRKK